MLRDLFTIGLTLCIALGLGGWSAREATRHFSGFGQIEVDGWSAQPNEGAPGADTYIRARVARDGEFVLGAAEGLRFWRETDDTGEPLEASCSYSVAGLVSDARAWSLTMSRFGEDGALVNETGLTNSFSVLYEPDGTIDMVLSKTIQPGNWHRLDAEGPFALNLNLYDTSVVSSTGLTIPSLPAVTRIECADG